MTPEEKKILGLFVGIVILCILGYLIYNGKISLPSMTTTVVTTIPATTLPVTTTPVTTTPVIPTVPVKESIVKNFDGVDTGKVKGSLQGSAYVDPVESCIRLTDAKSNQNGYFMYDSGLPDDFDISFTYRASRSTATPAWKPADSIYFFWKTGALPDFEFGIQPGLRVVFQEYSGVMGVYAGDGKKISVLREIPYTNTSGWTPVRITNNQGLLNVYWNGSATPTFSALIPSSAIAGGARFGFGARCGSSNNIHQVNNIDIKPL